MVVLVLRRVLLWAMVAVLVTLWFPAGAWARANATSLRLGVHPDGVTRLVVDLSESIDFNTALYSDPYRAIINTSPMEWASAATVTRARGAVSSLHFDQDGLGGRVTIGLTEPALVKNAFVIPPRDGQGWRLVVDLQATNRAAFLASATPARGGGPVATAETPSHVVAKPVLSESRSARVKVPEARPAPETPRSIVVYSPAAMPANTVAAANPAPAAVPEPAAASPAVTVATVPHPQPEPRPASRDTKGAASPVMSAPVPPPLERPASVAAATPAMAAPVPDPVVNATKVSAPVMAPEPMEPKALPADGKPVVVIDPGHGGVDPGAIGVSGIYEKYITLAVARELKAQLEKNGRYKVYLTRDRDIFIRLRDRIAIARQYNADLFISLHADTVANSQMKGLSVYTLSQNASDSEAQALADKENKADLIAGIDLSHESSDVANILIDLAQRETMNRSAGFATGVVDEVGRDVELLGNTHRFAGFAVLKAPDVPAVLIETGYLSNDTEERNLRQPEYRAKLAKSIARAVDRFFLQGQKARHP